MSKLAKLSGLVTFLLSNAVLAESYQSFSAISYSHASYSANSPTDSFYSKSDSNTFSLHSQYFFDEKETLGPLNEFDYINSSSSVSASLSNSSGDHFTSSNGNIFDANTRSKNVRIGGEWITHNVILGASYSHHNSEAKGSGFFYDNSDNNYSASLGYLLSDDLVIRANYNDGGGGDDFFNYSASYNWQLAGTDYIGFSYGVDEDFDIHNLSTRYFFGIAEQSYLVLGGNYTLDNSDNYFADNYWGLNASYYYDSKTSISASYGENDFYSVSGSYFINQNYSVQAGYHSVDNSKFASESDGYFLSFSAQF